MHGNILTGTPLTGVECRWGRNRDSEPISGSIACCKIRACNTLSCNRPWRVMTLVAGKRQSLLMAEEQRRSVWQEASMLHQRQHYAVVNLMPKYFVEANYWRTQSIAHLSATAELLVKTMAAIEKHCWLLST